MNITTQQLEAFAKLVDINDIDEIQRQLSSYPNIVHAEMEVRVDS